MADMVGISNGQAWIIAAAGPVAAVTVGLLLALGGSLVVAICGGAALGTIVSVAAFVGRPASRP